MVKVKCPVCRKVKEAVGPKIVGGSKIQDERLVKQIDTLITKVMCKECWKKSKK